MGLLFFVKEMTCLQCSLLTTHALLSGVKYIKVKAQATAVCVPSPSPSEVNGSLAHEKRIWPPLPPPLATISIQASSRKDKEQSPHMSSFPVLFTESPANSAIHCSFL